MASNDSSRSRRLPLALGVVGVVLIGFAIFWTTSEFNAAVDPSTEEIEGTLTVECGNAFHARGLSASTESDRAELVFPDEEDNEALRTQGIGSVQTTFIESADACQSDASGRLRVSGVAVVLGLAGLVAAVVVARRGRGAPEGPADTA